MNHLDTILDIVMAEAEKRFIEDKCEQGCTGSMARKIHSVMMDLAVELAKRMRKE